MRWIDLRAFGANDEGFNRWMLDLCSLWLTGVNLFELGLGGLISLLIASGGCTGSRTYV